MTNPVVLTGLAAEARIARRLGWPVVVGGGTEAGAQAAMARAVADGATALVSFGLAGGLDPSLRPGDIVVPAAVLAGGRRYPVSPTLAALLGGLTAGDLLAGDRIVTTAADKRALFAATGAVAVDLESRTVAMSGLPFAVLRAVCDPAGRDLPPAASIALDQAGAIGAGRVAWSILMHPFQLPGLLALANDAARARWALTRRVTEAVSARVQSDPR